MVYVCRVLALGALLAAGLVLPALAHHHEAGEERAAEAPASLYERLGGYDALAAVTDDFIARLAGDPQLERFFAGHSTDSLQRIRQLIIEQLCAATGGPCVYTGRDMETSHRGLGITKADWQASVGHLEATFDKLQVPARERGEVMALLATLEAQIVEAEASE